ncbi:RING/U-box superfamily protein [Abeliophyllum distichum]|uniref:RING/U-box superfamily protein n=1 Tax=Abeliophyllum distichum TaxID=126358 RepID=A0ABD1NXY0_9LAMI
MVSPLHNLTWISQLDHLDQVPSSSESRNEEYSGNASASDTLVYEENEESPPVPFPERNWEYSGGFPQENYMRTENGGSQFVRDDNSSCLFVVLTFLVSVSLTLIFGVYGSTTMRLGPNSSILIKLNPIFVEYVKVEEIDSGDGPMLYGFYGIPVLDVVTTWSEIHKTTLHASTHKDWIHFLNAGSQINISYNVNPPSSSSLVLVIAQGNEGLAQWIDDPLYPNTTLSWNIIHGNGTIQQHVSKSSTYYIAVANLNTEVVEVHLNFRINAFLYNTTGAYYKCTPAHSQCVFNLHFLGRNAALLSSPGRKSGMANGGWLVKLSYGPRWIIYVVGVGGMTVLVLLMYRFLNRSQYARQDQGRDQFRAIHSERNPLLSHKDHLSSGGSSYDSVSHDNEFSEEGLVGGSMEGKPVEDSEYTKKMMSLCAICYDAPRDSFFLPCGHSVACFACATRIAEAAHTCPICRRHFKKSPLPSVDALLPLAEPRSRFRTSVCCRPMRPGSALLRQSFISATFQFQACFRLPFSDWRLEIRQLGFTLQIRFPSFSQFYFET